MEPHSYLFTIFRGEALGSRFSINDLQVILRAFLLKSTELEGNQLARRELMQNTAITKWPLDRVYDSG